MNAIVTNLAGKHAKKVISENTKRYTPDDPLYIFWVDDNGKQKRTNVSQERETVTSSAAASNY